MAKQKPIPRSAPDVWWEGLRWVEGAWMQSERFQDVFYEWQSALLDAGWRSRLTDPSHEWRKHFDQDYDEYDAASRGT